MKPIRSKTARLEAITPFLEQGKVFIAEAEWTEDLCHDLTQFPYVAKKDVVDSFSWCLTYYALFLDREKIIHNNHTVIEGMRKQAVQRFSSEENKLFVARKGGRASLYEDEPFNSEPTYSRTPRHRARGRGIGYDSPLL
jgi:hypothetical protein